jgi:hypothetical protein
MRVFQIVFPVLIQSFFVLSIFPIIGCTSNSGQDDEQELYEEQDQDEGCVPDCDNKNCGDDGCGGECGYCTSRLCEDDECIDGDCVYTSMDDQTLTCEGFALTYCLESEWNYLWCPDACREAGYNTVYGCGVEGADSEVCNCGNLDDTCTQDMEVCLSSTDLYGCIASEGFFYQTDCEGACQSLGHIGSAGCINDACSCYDTNADGSLCLPAGERCDSGNLFCCAGLVCSSNGSVSTCQESTPCPSQCLSPGGDVCCGGALCSGDCIGNPCCD